MAPSDEIWILVGCPTPMVLRRTTTYFKVVSPAYIHNIMNGEAVEGVCTPDTQSGWKPIVKKGVIKGPSLEGPYTSGKGKWTVEIISMN